MGPELSKIVDAVVTFGNEAIPSNPIAAYGVMKFTTEVPRANRRYLATVPVQLAMDPTGNPQEELMEFLIDVGYVPVAMPITVPTPKCSESSTGYLATQCDTTEYSGMKLRHRDTSTESAPFTAGPLGEECII